MHDNPLVSVIIPSYNTAHYIRETLDSVFAQTYTNYEPVVINDGSPDTPELERTLAPYMDRIRYLTRPNGGLSAARNTGIRACTGELIAILDSDDIWEPDYLANQLERMYSSSPRVDLVYGDSVFMGGPQDGCRFMDLFPSEGEVTFESFVSRKCNVNISVLARREAIVAAGLFDESLRRCEDFDMWGRLLKAGCRIGYHRKVLMRYRRHAQSLSADEIAMCRTIISVYRKFLAQFSVSPAEREAIQRQIERYGADILFCEGKAAFVQSDFTQAAEKIATAGQILGNRRMQWISRLVRVCPRLLHRAYLLRYPQAS
jgi:glycosyltransferase involved in cell wall biosynthesis